MFHYGNHGLEWRVCNEINYTGLAKINETNGAKLTFVLMFLLKSKSIKAITHEYKYRGNTIIIDKKSWRLLLLCIYNVNRIQCYKKGFWALLFEINVKAYR